MQAFRTPPWCYKYYGDHITYGTHWQLITLLGDSPLRDTMLQAMQEELWEKGIDVNELIPGPVATDATKQHFRVGGAPPFAPSERVKTPEEVAPLALWLATQGAGGPTAQSFSLTRRPI